MKKLLVILGLVLATAVSSQAQLMKLTSLAAGTSSNILSQAAIVSDLVFLNASTNAATVTLYDTSNTTTNFVQAAYTSYASYATNYDVVVTNIAGVVYTNSFSGIYTCPTAVSAVTNARPSVAVFVIPASSSLSRDVNIQVVRGLAAVPSEALTMITTYKYP